MAHIAKEKRAIWPCVSSNTMNANEDKLLLIKMSLQSIFGDICLQGFAYGILKKKNLTHGIVHTKHIYLPYP